MGTSSKRDAWRARGPRPQRCAFETRKDTSDERKSLASQSTVAFLGCSADFLDDLSAKREVMRIAALMLSVLTARVFSEALLGEEQETKAGNLRCEFLRISALTAAGSALVRCSRADEEAIAPLGEVVFEAAAFGSLESR
jgi:hypothetical protein